MAATPIASPRARSGAPSQSTESLAMSSTSPRATRLAEDLGRREQRLAGAQDVLGQAPPEGLRAPGSCRARRRSRGSSRGPTRGRGGRCRSSARAARRRRLSWMERNSSGEVPARCAPPRRCGRRRPALARGAARARPRAPAARARPRAARPRGRGRSPRSRGCRTTSGAGRRPSWLAGRHEAQREVGELVGGVEDEGEHRRRCGPRAPAGVAGPRIATAATR